MISYRRCGGTPPRKGYIAKFHIKDDPANDMENRIVPTDAGVAGCKSMVAFTMIHASAPNFRRSGRVTICPYCDMIDHTQ